MNQLKLDFDSYNACSKVVQPGIRQARKDNSILRLEQKWVVG